jgi:hypothetical protein
LKVFHFQFKTPIDKKRRKLLAKFEISVKALPKRKSLDLPYISSYFTGTFTALFCHCRNTKMRNYGKWEGFLCFSSVVPGFKVGHYSPFLINNDFHLGSFFVCVQWKFMADLAEVGRFVSWKIVNIRERGRAREGIREEDHRGSLE